MNELELLWQNCPGEVIAYGAAAFFAAIALAVSLVAWIGGMME